MSSEPIQVDRPKFRGSGPLAQAERERIAEQEHLVTEQEWAKKAADEIAARRPYDLTAEDFTVQWDADHRYPFFESADGETWYGYGHQEPSVIVGLINENMKLSIGEKDWHEGNGICEHMVQHVWAVGYLPANTETEWAFTWGGVTDQTPDAFPLTVVSPDFA